MRRVGILIVAAALFAALCIGTSTAQTQGHLERKVVRIAPFYPEIAKRMHVGGVVKLEVLVRANGTVRSTKALGGHPVLIPSASDAVRQWKFEPTPEETTETVQVVFELS